jgi:S-adenosylmethionine synthetase
MTMKTLFTAESVTEGHPDKICDQISDSLVDAYLAKDAHSRVAAEVAVKNDKVMIFGEITSQANIDPEILARQKIAEISFINSNHGFSADSCEVIVILDKQSLDIAQGVNQAREWRDKGGEDLWVPLVQAIKD